MKDVKEFEVIDKKDGLAGLTQLMPDKNGCIGGTPYNLVQAIVTNLDDKAPIPKHVTIVQRLRKRVDVRPKRSLFNKPFPKIELPDLRQLKELAWASKYVDVLVPDWIHDFRVVSTSLEFDEVVVENNAILEISENITSLSANNFYMYQGARVLQLSRSLTVDITGEMKGDLASL